jgi:outer membrane protein OmpA-like peptidoglycan-associated protein
MPLFDGWDGVTEGRNDVYLQHSIGLIFGLGKGKSGDADGDGVPDKRDKCPNTPAGVSVDRAGCPLDTDGDGIPDYLDRCPKVAGIARLGGCPDSDGDGVADIDDRCPGTPAGVTVDGSGCPLDSDGDGIADVDDKCPNTPKGVVVNLSGCPEDSDGDGVPDYLDQCPNTPKGIRVDARGCPLDRDGDGVPDDIDKCPDNPGPASNYGCPEVRRETRARLQYVMHGIYFETGKARLQPVSYPMLDEVVTILGEYPGYNLRLSGHTDAVGSDAANLVLSQARVDAVKSYLVSKNVPEYRVEATGYGKTRPVASNATAKGRALNRRVELELFLK